MADRPVPVLGGHLDGWTPSSEVQPVEPDAALDRVAAGELVLEPHSALVRLPGAGRWRLAAAMAVDDVRYGYYSTAAAPRGSAQPHRCPVTGVRTSG